MRHVAALIASIAIAAPLAAAEQQKPPYWASISAGEAKMRTGPDRTYPATWLYRRAGLPVKVIATHKEWRQVEDPDGAQGWMQASLLSAARTAMVRGQQPAPMLEAPQPGAKLRFRAAPGVVGKVSKCGDGWCQLDVKGRAGFVQVSGLWGVEPTETLP
jgi:SH3-like domain-containing protein